VKNKKYNNVILPLILSLAISACGGSNEKVSEKTTDITAPIITLIGDDVLTISLGDTFQEPGSTVTDNVDTGLIASASGNVDSSTPGSYTITYNTTDVAGNTTTITRTVIVETVPDNESPIITLIGDATINLTLGDSYTEEGVTITDNIDNIDNDMSTTTSGSVDTNTIGSYIITYSATDTAGNTATVTRTVIVEDITILPIGDGYIFHSANDDSYYIEYWGDTWGTDTVYTDETTDTTYAKALEISKSAAWGTVVAWGNEPENTIDISAYTHAKFKIKTDSFTSVEVSVQSTTLPESKIIYNISSGLDLGNGWFEMQVALPAFTDMTWFGLNFIGDAGTTVLLADVYFTTLDEEPVEGPPEAAPTPPAYTDNEVIVLYSDSLSQDNFIGVWNANWWNAPIYSTGNINGDNFAKYEITAGGVEGGVTGLEFGFEIEPLDASSTTTWNFDLFVEPGISKIEVQLVSKDGGAKYIIENPTTGAWSNHKLLFADLIDNDGAGIGVLNSGALQSIGIQLWGQAGQAIFVDNIYFSGQSVSYDLAVTITDDNNVALANATVSVGNVSANTDTSGIATLHLPEGEHKVIANATGFGLTQGNQRIAGGDTSFSLSVIPLNDGPSVSAPIPTDSNDDAFVIYSDALTVDKTISFWSDNWWNAPTFSEITIAGDNIAKLQIIPDGTSGGVTGVQYGIQDGVVDVSTKTGLRFDMYASSGITRAVFQIVSKTGPGISTITTVVSDQWVTVELPFADLVDSTGNFDSAVLTQLGIQLWGSTSDAFYIDNIYFY
jgi:hypothetical protein